MTGNHRTLRLTAEVRQIEGRDVVLASDQKGEVIAARALEGDRPCYVAQVIRQVIRQAVEQELNTRVLQRNAMAGDLVEQPFRVVCLFLGGVA